MAGKGRPKLTREQRQEKLEREKKRAREYYWKHREQVLARVTEYNKNHAEQKRKASIEYYHRKHDEEIRLNGPKKGNRVGIIACNEEDGSVLTFISQNEAGRKFGVTGSCIRTWIRKDWCHDGWVFDYLAE